MKTKKNLIIVIILFLGIMFYYFKYVMGWLEYRRDTSTPEKFLNYVQIPHEEYFRDSVLIIDELKTLMKNRVGFFQNSAYFDSTQLIVDTILYSQDFDKVAILVLAKNPTSRQLSPNNEIFWYYDATCYLGNRSGDSIALAWVGPILTNAGSRKDASEFIREACFINFVSKEEDMYLYNVNDIRFWSSPIWESLKYNKGRKEIDTMRNNSSEKILLEH